MNASEPGRDVARRHDAAYRSAVEAQSKGRFGLALELFEECLAHAETLEDRRRMHAARINISSCWLSLGEPAEARKDLPAVILESDDPAHVSASAANLAEALAHQGRLGKAAHYLRIALEQARIAGNRSQEFSALCAQGNLAVLEGRHGDAVEAYAEAAMAWQVARGCPGEIDAALLDNLGYARLLAGDVTGGLRDLHRSLRGARRAGNRRVEAEAEKDIAFGFLLSSKNAAAMRHALRAREIARDGGYPSVLKNAYYILMEVSLRLDRSGDFEDWFTELQRMLPDVTLSRDFFRIFDISDVIDLKEMT